MIPWHDGLTERQRRFCEAYASNGGNAMAAATSAGYARPQQQGAENLEKPGVRTALEAMRQATTSAAIATRAERQALWTSILRAELVDGDGMPPKFVDRLKASELLGKSQADFLERVDHSNSDGSLRPAVIQIVAKQ